MSKKTKKIGLTGLVLSLALCFTAMCGNVMSANAASRICGGNHRLENVRYVGYRTVGDAHIHRHNDHWCATVTCIDQYLKRCACGYEKVEDSASGPYIKHAYLFK